MANDTDRVCRMCGTPFSAPQAIDTPEVAPAAPNYAPSAPTYAPTYAPSATPVSPVAPTNYYAPAGYNAPAPVAVKKGSALKSVIVTVIIIAILAGAAFGGFYVYNNKFGVKGAANKFMKSLINGDVSGIKSVCSTAYDPDYLEDVFGNNIYSSKLDDYKITYTIKKVSKVSSKQLDTINDYMQENCDIKIKDARIVKIKVTSKEKESGDTNSRTLNLVFTKEDGKWKYLIGENSLEYLESCFRVLNSPAPSDDE